MCNSYGMKLDDALKIDAVLKGLKYVGNRGYPSIGKQPSLRCVLQPGQKIMSTESVISAARKTEGIGAHPPLRVLCQFFRIQSCFFSFDLQTSTISVATVSHQPIPASHRLAAASRSFATTPDGENSPLIHPSRRYKILPQRAATLLSWVTIRMVVPS